jgi:hypothetical protein
MASMSVDSPPARSSRVRAGLEALSRSDERKRGEREPRDREVAVARDRGRRVSAAEWRDPRGSRVEVGEIERSGGDALDPLSGSDDD